MHPLRAANVACPPEVIHEMIARAFALRHSDPEGMLHECELAFLAAERSGDEEAYGVAAAFVGNALRILDRRAEARRVFEVAVAVIAQCRDASRARILELFATFKIYEGQPEEALSLLEEVRNIRSSTLEGEGLATTLIQLALAHSECGRPRTALDTITQALTFLPKHGRLYLVALNNGIAFLNAVGRPAQAWGAYLRLEALFNEEADASLLASRRLVAGNIRKSLGDWTGAADHYLASAVMFESVGNVIQASVARAELALL